MTPIEDLEAKLSQLDDTFKSAPTDGFGYELPEPGDYQAVFRAVDFFESKKAPFVPYIKLTFEIELDPLYEGREVDVIHPLVPDGPDDYVQTKLAFLKKDLKALGIAVDDEDFSFAQVRPGSAIWDGVLDSPYRLAIRDSKKLSEQTGRPFRNVYINERLGGPLPKQERLQMGSDVPVSKEDMASPKPVEADESIPFRWREVRYDDKYHGWSHF
jgi:hypothetical protein